MALYIHATASKCSTWIRQPVAIRWPQSGLSCSFCLQDFEEQRIVPRTQRSTASLRDGAERESATPLSTGKNMIFSSSHPGIPSSTNHKQKRFCLVFRIGRRKRRLASGVSKRRLHRATLLRELKVHIDFCDDFNGFTVEQCRLITPLLHSFKSRI